MKDLMIDIETMGKEHDAAILSISACYFDRKTSEIGEKFDQQINLENSLKGGRTICASTLLWWLEQDDKARLQFKSNKKAKGLVEVLNPKKDMPFVGVRHNALDDSIHQAKYVSAIIQKITS